jgi:hypothetical protein
MKAISTINSMKDAHIVMVDDKVLLFKSEWHATRYLESNYRPIMETHYEQGFITHNELLNYPKSFYGIHYVKLSDYIGSMNREELAYALTTVLMEQLEEGKVQ